MLDTDLFNSNVRPAVNVGLSVSRVGFSAAVKAMKQVGGTLKLDLAQYREMAAFAQFGSELDPASQRLLNRGSRLTEMLKQNQYDPLPIEKEVLIIFAGNEGYFDQLSIAQIRPFEKALYAHFDARHADLLAEIKSKRELSDELRKKLKAALDELRPVVRGANEKAASRGLTRVSLDDGIAKGNPAADRFGQIDPADHARDETGRRLAPAPRAGGAEQRPPL